MSEGTAFTMQFAILGQDSIQQLPDGSVRIVAARITSPERWAGQVRDVTRHPDGSVTLGPDRRCGDVAETAAEPRR